MPSGIYKRKTPPTATERFHQRYIIDPKTGCWNWTATLIKSGGGYGQIDIGKKKRIYAHRLSYLIHYGPFDDSLFVCHKCDNSKCVNPKHLFLGTQAANMKDMVAKGRRARGEAVFQSKLTEPEVVEIRKKYKPGVVTQTFLADEYSVSQSTIREIITRQIWKHI